MHVRGAFDAALGDASRIGRAEFEPCSLRRDTKRYPGQRNGAMASCVKVTHARMRCRR